MEIFMRAKLRRLGAGKMLGEQRSPTAKGGKRKAPLLGEQVERIVQEEGMHRTTAR